MEWKVAPTYKSWQIVNVDENAHKAYISTKCWKCGGSGQYAWFGTCYACGGSGYHTKWVKAYTPDEYEKYVSAQEKAKEKRVAAAIAKKKELEDNSEVNKKALLEKFGFDAENPMVYLVAGGNTYSIKDELKTRGGRYNADFNWYFTKETEVPEGFELVTVNVDDVYDWFPQTKRLELKENAKKVADAAKAQIKTHSNSEFIGKVKERLRDLKVTLTEARAVSSAYGESVLFTFTQGENVLVWFTSCPPDEDKAIVGHEYLLTATVKDHKLYDGVKQTYVNRCILKEFAI